MLKLRTASTSSNNLPPHPLSQVILERIPLRVAVAGKTLDLPVRKTGPSLLEGRVGDLAVAVRYDYLEDPPALRWNVVHRNEGKTRLENVSVIPLLVRFSLDPDRDHPRGRRLSGSYHFDAGTPRARSA